MKRQEFLFLLVVLVIIVLLVLITANLDVLFPTPSPVSFAKAAVNRSVP